MCAPSLSLSSDVPFVFPAFVLFFLPNLLPPPTVAAVSRPTLVDAGLHRVLLRQRTCMSASFHPFLLYETLKVGGGEGWGSLICCLWYPFDGPASPVYMAFPYYDVDSDLEIHAGTTIGCSYLVFLALGYIRSVLRPHWRNGLHGV
ncbi:hypothetical protein ZEAMMB73_Zm00001d037368 [Zea mays]|uniref:Uncharacterized protein n=1 Tax=Zea mays TaxID=4577 RepID=A0A1D6LX58_MAIZE|nr:hypothetical protein ZEAMMB73_Zm00001d037368 [Zea mays]